jgi:hypothetical protein
MKLVIFLKDFGGYMKGNGQYYDEEFADVLIKKGVVRDINSPEPKEKAVEAPPKDKMVKAPKKKK